MYPTGIWTEMVTVPTGKRRKEYIPPGDVSVVSVVVPSVIVTVTPSMPVSPASWMPFWFRSLNTKPQTVPADWHVV